MCFVEYNARTGLKLDYLESEDNTDIHIPLDIYEADYMNLSQIQTNMGIIYY